MADELLKKIIDGYWLGEKERKILEDSWPWDLAPQPDDLVLSVSVGPPYKIPEEIPEFTNDMYRKLNRLRIDAVVQSFETRWITEVTPSIGAGSTGKVELYTEWYSEDKGVDKDFLQPTLLGREYHESVEPYCDRNGIWLGEVYEGGGMDWVISHG